MIDRWKVKGTSHFKKFCNFYYSFPLLFCFVLLDNFNLEGHYAMTCLWTEMFGHGWSGSGESDNFFCQPTFLLSSMMAVCANHFPLGLLLSLGSALLCGIFFSFWSDGFVSWAVLSLLVSWWELTALYWRLTTFLLEDIVSSRSLKIISLLHTPFWFTGYPPFRAMCFLFLDLYFPYMAILCLLDCGYCFCGLVFVLHAVCFLYMITISLMCYPSPCGNYYLVGSLDLYVSFFVGC